MEVEENIVADVDEGILRREASAEDLQAKWETARLHRCFFFSSRRRHTRFDCDWSSDVCSSDLAGPPPVRAPIRPAAAALLKVHAGNVGQTVRRAIPPAPGFAARDSAPALSPKIGRASCRERV